MHYSLIFHNRTLATRIFKMAAIFQDGRHFRYAIRYNFDTVRHVMDKIRNAVMLLNPGQVPVITADQPIYATAKQIRWQWPEDYGESHFLIMFGGLHI